MAYGDQQSVIFHDDLENNLSIYQAYPIQEHPLSFHEEDVSVCSGGQKQMIAFYRYLNTKKPILLLDEPFSALDEENRHQLLSYLRGLTDKTVIMISHDEKDLVYFDRVIGM